MTPSHHALDAHLQTRFGELRSAAHSLTGDERWNALCELLNDWPKQHLVEIVLPYLQELLRDDDSERSAPPHWFKVSSKKISVHPALRLARTLSPDYLLDPSQVASAITKSHQIQHIVQLNMSWRYLAHEHLAALLSSPT